MTESLPFNTNRTPAPYALHSLNDSQKSPRLKNGCGASPSEFFRPLILVCKNSQKITPMKTAFSKKPHQIKGNNLQNPNFLLSSADYLREVLSRNGRSHRLNEAIEVSKGRSRRRADGGFGQGIVGINSILHLSGLRDRRRLRRRRLTLQLQLLLLELPPNRRRIVEAVGAVAARERKTSGPLHFGGRFSREIEE